MVKSVRVEQVPPPGVTRFEDEFSAEIVKWESGGTWRLEGLKVKPETFYQRFKEWTKRSGKDLQIHQRGKQLYVTSEVSKRKPTAKKRAKR